MSIYTNGNNEYAQSYSKSYVSLKPFNGELYTYSLSMNAQFKPTGTLVVSTAGSAALCPANRVLHVTGKRLVPGINPMSVFPAGSPLASTVSPGKLLLSVYDPVTFVTGFIDPTSTTFAKYDQNLPNSFNLGIQGAAEPPLGGLAGNGVATKLYVGPVATGSGNVGSSSVGQVTFPPGSPAGGSGASVTTLAFNSATSQVFLTGISAGGGAGAFSSYYSVPAGLSNTFNISTNGTGLAGATVNWMVVN